MTTIKDERQRDIAAMIIEQRAHGATAEDIERPRQQLKVIADDAENQPTDKLIPD